MKYNVLIVEDEMFVRIGIANCIDWESNGLKNPLQAANGKEAWEIIKNNNIDIVLTDIKMPEMDGISLIKKIREADLPVEVIVLSCLNEFELVQRAIRLGIRDYIFKPTLMPEEILAAIKKVINKIEAEQERPSTLKQYKNYLVQLRVHSILPNLCEASYNRGEIEGFSFKIGKNLDRIMEKRYRSDIQRAIRYMEKHLGDEDIGLESVAKHVNMSKNYFSRLFKEDTEVNFIEFLTKLRIEKARELYLTTDLKIYQIAEKVGYSDWRYFSKVYKKYVGKPLSQLR